MILWHNLNSTKTMTKSDTDSETVSFTSQVIIKLISAEQAKELVEEDKQKV